MGTSNFALKNASKYFTHDAEESWEYDDHVDAIRESLESKDYSEEKEWDGERSYGGFIFAEKRVSKFNDYFEAIITIKAIRRNGYYQGVNYDYSIELEIGYFSEDISNGSDDSIMHVLEGGIGDAVPNNGLAKILVKSYKKWVDKTVKELVEELEAVYQTHTTPMNCVARFSNGEAWYAVEGKTASDVLDAQMEAGY